MSAGAFEYWRKELADAPRQGSVEELIWSWWNQLPTTSSESVAHLQTELGEQAPAAWAPYIREIFIYHEPGDRGTANAYSPNGHLEARIVLLPGAIGRYMNTYSGVAVSLLDAIPTYLKELYRENPPAVGSLHEQLLELERVGRRAFREGAFRELAGPWLSVYRQVAAGGVDPDLPSLTTQQATAVSRIHMDGMRFIVAHEIAHHLLGHTGPSSVERDVEERVAHWLGGNRNPPAKSSHIRERDADQAALFLLSRLKLPGDRFPGDRAMTEADQLGRAVVSGISAAAVLASFPEIAGPDYALRGVPGLVADQSLSHPPLAERISTLMQPLWISVGASTAHPATAASRLSVSMCFKLVVAAGWLAESVLDSDLAQPT